MGPKPRILIGFLTKENTGAMPTITRAFIRGLSERYEFIPHYSNRRFGVGYTGNVNPFNFFYFLKHLGLWILRLAVYRPQIAHYPVTSYWNLEKSLTFLVVAQKFGAKVVGHLHGGSFDVFWNTLSQRRKDFALNCLNSLDLLIVLSDGWRNWVLQNTKLSEKKVVVVINPIDREFEQVALSFPPSESSSFFFMGSLGKRKGVYDILSVAAKLKSMESSFQISISGPEEVAGALDSILGIISSQSLNNVKLLPPLYGGEKINYFRDNGIFLFPSYNENFPLVILEAAAAGRAIITTRVGALPEYFVHNESVLYVEPGNVTDITNAVLWLLRDRLKRIELGAAARKTFSGKLGTDIVLKSLHQAYDGLLLTQNQALM